MPDSDPPASPGPGVKPNSPETHATKTSPDVSESSHPERLEDPIPAETFSQLPIVGLGGSAGSLAPLQTFFAQAPVDSGMAFVVVLHLSPDYESSMAEILGRATRMPVTQIRDQARVEANHVYVIPPGKHLVMTDGQMTLTDIERERGKRVAVDLFFRTLADTHGPNAIAIVLSGADADGAIGIKRIKERGGLTIAQDPQEAEQSSMPRSAIATGMIDLILRAAEIAPRLVEFRRNGDRLQLPGLVAPTAAGLVKAEGDHRLHEILSLLRANTGRDFAGYKHGTILRRIARRMQVNGTPDLRAYHTFLRTHRGEAGALLQDLLISVTNFFRDREAFERLQAELPGLFKGKGPGDTIRVWVPGCATGEEAYSIAILLSECAAKFEAPPRLQVFATDIDEGAIVKARLAEYPETIVTDVSEERLRRFFVRQRDHYRVSQAVRELVLFAVHDVLRDPPFSRLDLVSCRNLMIYFTREAQRQVFDVFHFSLRPEGCLFLGTSETTDEAAALFAPIDKKSRIYRRVSTLRVVPPMFVGPSSVSLAFGERAAERIVLPGKAAPAPSAAAANERAGVEGISVGEFHLKLIEQFAPPSLIVDADGRIVHLSPKAGRFLRLAGGELTKDVLQLVHPMLRIELRAALFRAADTSAAVEVRGVPVELENGHPRAVNISVRPAPEFAPGYMLVVLEEVDGAMAGTPPGRPVAPDDTTRSLERELEITKESLRVTREEHGASSEEMKAANEELQAMNEELRSASEELETGREELQSINEELITVNQDLKAKVDELARSNSDTQNLMAATNVATVFLDEELRIMRYTPPAVALFHLIASDIGRPLVDLRHRLEFDSIFADAEDVLKNFKPIERAMRAHDGRHFLARTTAYRTADDHVAGVVLTFVDVTPLKKAEDAVRDSEARFRAIIDQTAVGVCLADLSGKITFANPHLGMIANCDSARLVGKKLSEFVKPGGDAEYRADLERLARDGSPFDVEMCLPRAGGEEVWCNVNLAAIHDATGTQTACVAVFVDTTRRKHAEEGLRVSREGLEARVQQRTEQLADANRSLRGEVEERMRMETSRGEMMRALAAAQEEERGRISRELHDEIGQHITALLLGLKSLEKELPPKSSPLTTVQSLQVITENVSRDIHEVALELRPTALDDLGLVRALSTFLEDWAARSHIEVAFDHAGLGEARLPNYLETTLYRVVCESMRNVVKHAQAKSVSIILQRKPGQVVAIVEDDGVGFEAAADAPGAAKRLGIVGMKERVALVNGEITIESEPKRGTTVIVRLPLPADENRK